MPRRAFFALATANVVTSFRAWPVDYRIVDSRSMAALMIGRSSIIAAHYRFLPRGAGDEPRMPLLLLLASPRRHRPQAGAGRRLPLFILIRRVAGCYDDASDARRQHRRRQALATAPADIEAATRMRVFAAIYAQSTLRYYHRYL